MPHIRFNFIFLKFHKHSWCWKASVLRCTALFEPEALAEKVYNGSLDSRRGWEGAGAETAPVLCVLAYIFRPVEACPLQAHAGNVPNQFMFIQEKAVNSSQLEGVQGLWVHRNLSLSDNLLYDTIIETSHVWLTQLPKMDNKYIKKMYHGHFRNNTCSYKPSLHNRVSHNYFNIKTN